MLEYLCELSNVAELWQRDKLALSQTSNSHHRRSAYFRIFVFF